MSVVSVGPFVSKYTDDLVELHKGISATVYEFPDDNVLKVYKGTAAGYATNEMMIASRNWNGIIVTPSSVNYDPKTQDMEIVTKRGKRCELINEEQVYQLIHNLAVMESHGIVHGDIKPSNIVLIDDRPCMIDFGTLSTRNEYAEDLQSIKDKIGYATIKYRIPGYDAISAALYALGVTICLLTGLISQKLLVSKVSVMVDIKIGIITDQIEVHELTYHVEKQYKSLCNANPLLRKLLCPSKWRIGSFWQLLSVRVDTRTIYDKCAENYRSCRVTAIMIEGYFRYGVSDITTLINITHGECMLWFINENHTGRLLDEYHSPGCWYTHHQPIYDREGLTTRITVDSPKIAMYHSEGMTMLMDTKPTVSVEQPRSDIPI